MNKEKLWFPSPYNLGLDKGISTHYGTDVHVNEFESLVTDTHTCVAETHKLMSNVYFRKSWSSFSFL